ncbi:TPA: hypothetical protein N0F65_005313, partial [Lagenidium giganteum]
LPIQFQRIQFPLQPAFAITINKAQGQSLKHVGIFLPEPVLAHGQLYVALSRVGSEDGLRILAPFDARTSTFYTRNIVYPEALLSANINTQRSSPHRSPLPVAPGWQLC